MWGFDAGVIYQGQTIGSPLICGDEQYISHVSSRAVINTVLTS